MEKTKIVSCFKSYQSQFDKSLFQNKLLKNIFKNLLKFGRIDLEARPDPPPPE